MENTKVKTHKDRVLDLSFRIARSSVSETRIATGHDGWKDAQSWFILGNEYMDFIEFMQEEFGFAEVEDLQNKFFAKQAKAQRSAYKKFKKTTYGTISK